jgi:hypothetical protein
MVADNWGKIRTDIEKCPDALKPKKTKLNAK